MLYKNLKAFVIEQTYKLNIFEAEKDLDSLLEQLYSLRRLLSHGIEDGPGKPINQDPVLKALADLINRNAEVFERIRKEDVYAHRLSSA